MDYVNKNKENNKSASKVTNVVFNIISKKAITTTS